MLSKCVCVCVCARRDQGGGVCALRTPASGTWQRAVPLKSGEITFCRAGLTIHCTLSSPLTGLKS